MMFDKLSAPFADVHWRAQNVTKDGSKALALAYIDARDVMDRLDEVCGPAGWQDSYAETPKGRLICTLSILSPDGDWITKSDGAGDTDVEGEKGAISDAFKRAAVKWGIGRYLYNLKDVWAPCESYKNGDKFRWSRWKPEAQRDFARALAECSPTQPGIAPIRTITEAQQTELMALFNATGVPVGDFLEVGNISDLREVPADKFQSAKGWINQQAHERKKQKESA